MNRQLTIPGAEAEPLKSTLERKASAPLKPKADQIPCDIGLFSDESSQLDLIEMFMD